MDVEEKKASVKFILLDSIKGKVVDNEIKSPIYVQIIYEGNNTKFKLLVDGKPILVKKELGDEGIAMHPSKERLNDTETKIINIIKYETNNFKNSYSLKGFQHKFTLYCTPIAKIFNVFSEGINEFLKEKMIYNDYMAFTKLISAEEKYLYLLEHDKRFNTDIFSNEKYSLYIQSLTLSFLFELIDTDGLTVYELVIENKSSLFDEKMEIARKTLKLENTHLFDPLEKRKPSVYISSLLEKLLKEI